MEIGLDFDGVIGDVAGLKIRYARDFCDIKLERKDCRADRMRLNGFSVELCETLDDTIYGTEYGLNMEPIPDAIGAINDLLFFKHNITVVTSRKNSDLIIVEKLLEKYSLKIPVKCTDQQSKSKYCRGMDLFVDDAVYKLYDLESIVPNLILFIHPYNSEVKTCSHIKKVGDWKILYSKIQKIDEYKYL